MLWLQDLLFQGALDLDNINLCKTQTNMVFEKLRVRKTLKELLICPIQPNEVDISWSLPEGTQMQVHPYLAKQ